MGHILALGGDIFAFVLIWRGFKLARAGQNKMTETGTDAKMRRIGGLAVILVGIFAIYFSHFVMA